VRFARPRLFQSDGALAAELKAAMAAGLRAVAAWGWHARKIIRDVDGGLNTQTPARQ
jgi:hypothetical protein